MHTIKEQVINLVESLPHDATLDDIMVELYFKLEVDTGLKELDAGQGIPHSRVKERLGIYWGPDSKSDSQ
jgi:hypothetical protein